MTDCTDGRFCPGCHPLRRAAALCIGIVVAYLGFLFVVLRWMP